MTATETAAYHATCRGCDRSITVRLTDTAAAMVGAPLRSVRCRRCGTISAALRRNCEGPDMTDCPWLVAWDDADCVFPEAGAMHWEGAADA